MKPIFSSVNLIVFVISTFMTITYSAEISAKKNAEKTYIQQMKKAKRGPFKRLRWFCKDGTILPPKPYACSKHGGGVQHGQWSNITKRLRIKGYYVANVIADVKVKNFGQKEKDIQLLKSYVLENFLIGHDDGWIFKKARYYRGAIQVEDETENAERLLKHLWNDNQWWQNRYLLLRETVRFLPHGTATGEINNIRNMATKISNADIRFMPLRSKIHGKPDRDDAKRVRDYAKTKGKAKLKEDYEKLASNIEKIFNKKIIQKTLRKLIKQVNKQEFKQWLQSIHDYLNTKPDLQTRFIIMSKVLARLRNNLTLFKNGASRLAVVDASIVLEEDLFTTTQSLLKDLHKINRLTRLNWLADAVNSLYGTGFILKRQMTAMKNTFKKLTGVITLKSYKAKLEYLARIPQWSDQRLRFHFNDLVSRWEHIEPQALLYFDDRLRGSPLLFYSTVLDSLIKDAHQLAGIEQIMFGEKVGAGLRALNPGIASGTLRIIGAHPKREDFSKNGIYVLPVTLAELPPVAGIITADEGSSLSHVQLLARNLGIPNVVIDEQLLPRLEKMNNQNVTLAVSPGGVVRVMKDQKRKKTLSSEEAAQTEFLINPDMKKLDLETKTPISIRNLRATDSGRLCGPKGANLAELKYFFPKSVTEGIVIPFGVFKALLDQPIKTGLSAFDWMKSEYTKIAKMPEDSTEQIEYVGKFLNRLQNWIIKARLDPDFVKALKTQMDQIFGKDGSYGVFVRSDTNVEDLPGFTGAGLNKTIPHKVGFKNILKAIKEVWASPFSERAYSWRQAHMKAPEHVYSSILLLKSVASEKSGVMVTQHIDSGNQNYFSVAINEGVGGAVDGQMAEQLLIHRKSKSVRLLSLASSPFQRTLLPSGGIKKIPASGNQGILTRKDIDKLLELVKRQELKFPMVKDSFGKQSAADIEFGFLKNNLVLFQIRPFVQSKKAQRNLKLLKLDKSLKNTQTILVNLEDIPTK